MAWKGAIHKRRRLKGVGERGTPKDDLVLSTSNKDYGHTMAKSLIFVAQIQIPIPNKYLGFPY
jgi:hypothetical protein